MKKLMVFWCGSLFGMLLACGSAVAADPLEQYLGEYAYVSEDNYCSGGLKFQRGERGAYLIEINNACGDEEAQKSGRVGLCEGEFLVPFAQKTLTGMVLRDSESESRATFTITPQGIEVQDVSPGICGAGAYMHGLYTRNVSAPTPKKTEEPKELTLCGTVQSEKAIGYDTAQVAFLEYKDEEDFYERKFKDGRVTIFYDDNKMPSNEFSAPCSQLVSQSLKRKLMFCFSVTQKPTPAELKKQGVKESTIYWGDNCVVPD